MECAARMSEAWVPDWCLFFSFLSGTVQVIDVGEQEEDGAHLQNPESNQVTGAD